VKIAYFDCFSGISGDMCLGAIVDAGVPLKALQKELKKLPVTGYRLSIKKAERGHLKACKVSVVIKQGLAVRAGKTWKDVRKIIQVSTLPHDIKQKGLSVFKAIFEAEAKVHGGNFQTVHLHELSAVDCMIDVFGTIIGLDLLGVKRIFSSPVNLGSGFVKTETGILPVPAPATAEILKNVPVYSHHVHTELTTPTGAAIIKELSSGHGDMPLMDIAKVGVGAGDRDFRHWPNVLRIFISTSSSPIPVRDKTRIPEEKVIVIETNIDDMNPQVFEHVIDMLYKAGSLDIYLTQVIMKKGRPGVKLTALCDEGRKEALMKIILRETSSIGLRYYETRRRVMQREIKTVETKFGKIRVKVSKMGTEIIKAAPEYEDCRKIARQFNIPLIEVMKNIRVKKARDLHL
jgi:pyridinium-3,5-bisthiocarboxylic acid mononucleotide nickel chelatase